MGPGFGDPSFFQYIDGIGMHNGAQAVGNEDGDLLPLSRDAADGFCNGFFGKGIQCGGGFIKDQEAGMAQ